MSTGPWRIIGKEEKRIDEGSVELTLHVERRGYERTAIVSGATFYSKKVGDDVCLPNLDLPPQS
jgi:5-methylthioribose kinase